MSNDEAVMIDSQYSEDGYRVGYEVVRDMLRQYDPQALIGLCFQYLHQPFEQHMDYLARQPWCVLLLVKWVLIDDKFTEGGRPIPRKKQVVDILQMVANLAGKSRMPSQHDYVRLFMRALVFQQFLYQRRSSIIQTGRQLHYFGSLDKDHYIPKTFREVTGLSLDRFLELSLAFHSAFMDEGRFRRKIGNQWFGELQGAEETGDIDRFLRLLSAPLADIRSALLSRDNKTIEAGRYPRSAIEYSEQTPLIQFPLLPLVTGDCLVIDPCLLENRLDNFVYSTLREHNVQRFMNPFGNIFEGYVRQAVECTGLEYRVEEQLKTLLRAKQTANLIDFIVADDNANVFVDAKAAEMNYRGTVTSDAVELAKLLDTSLLKAVQQANNVVTELERLNSTDSIFKPRERNYLIAVTYSRMNISNGRALAESVGIPAIEAAIAKDHGRLRIPIENMYFMTIEEFETLVANVAIGSIGLVEALERAKALDSDPMTSAFMFEQHLANWGL